MGCKYLSIQSPAVWGQGKQLPTATGMEFKGYNSFERQFIGYVWSTSSHEPTANMTEYIESIHFKSDPHASVRSNLAIHLSDTPFTIQ